MIYTIAGAPFILEKKLKCVPFLGNSQMRPGGEGGQLQYPVSVGPFVQGQVTEDGQQKFIQVRSRQLLNWHVMVTY